MWCLNEVKARTSQQNTAAQHLTDFCKRFLCVNEAQDFWNSFIWLDGAKVEKSCQIAQSQTWQKPNHAY